MRILITNGRLDNRGGAEWFVQDLARGLERLGHQTLAYTSDPGYRPRLVDNDLMPVATDLEHLPYRPDIIHAQHHLDAMTALTALPGVPAIYHCHGAVWRESPPRHPRIYHYVAVSVTQRHRMMTEANLAADDLTVVLNSVDLDRFRTVRTPPPRPRRALFFNKRHREGSETREAVREAAERHGLDFEIAGWPFDGSAPIAPETVLPQYDLVFASGRSAIEALACGCAVVVLGRTSCGELVRPDTYDRYRQVNFAIAVNSPPPSADAVAAEIDRYSPDGCREVTARLRTEADIRLSVDTLLRLYRDVVDRHQRAVPDPRAESLAVSSYLRSLVPLVNTTDRLLGGHWSSPDRASRFEQLRAQVARLEQRIEDFT